MYDKETIELVKVISTDFIFPLGWEDWAYDIVEDAFRGEPDDFVRVLVEPERLKSYFQDILEGEDSIDAEDMDEFCKLMDQLAADSVLVKLD
jgi:hypothetical protein